MPILGAATAIEPAGLTILVLLALAMLIIWPATVLRRRGIVGPVRVGSGESLFTIFGILIIGSAIWVFTPAALLPVVHLSKGHTTVVLMAIADSVAFIAMLVLSLESRPGGFSMLGLTRKKIFWALPTALVAAAAIFPLVYAASIFVELVIELAHRAMPAPHPMLQQLGVSRNDLWFALIVFEATVLAPLFEETLFRGHLQTLIGQGIQRLHGGNNPSALSRWIAVVITAILFGLVHGQIAFFFPLFVLALGLGYVYERTGNLWATMFLHAIFNGMQIIVYLRYAAGK